MHCTGHESFPIDSFCLIFCESLNLETARTDNDGKPLHEKCYFQKIVRKFRELNQFGGR